MLCSQDECSFVSLRDVERCMIVFEYFFEQMGLFSERMNDKATKENKEVSKFFLDHLFSNVTVSATIHCSH